LEKYLRTLYTRNKLTCLALLTFPLHNNYCCVRRTAKEKHNATIEIGILKKNLNSIINYFNVIITPISRWPYPPILQESTESLWRPRIEAVTARAPVAGRRNTNRHRSPYPNRTDTFAGWYACASLRSCWAPCRWCTCRWPSTCPATGRSTRPSRRCRSCARRSTRRCPTTAIGRHAANGVWRNRRATVRSTWSRSGTTAPKSGWRTAHGSRAFHVRRQVSKTIHDVAGVEFLFSFFTARDRVVVSLDFVNNMRAKYISTRGRLIPPPPPPPILKPKPQIPRVVIVIK